MKLKRWIISISAIVAILLATTIGGSFYLVDFALEHDNADSRDIEESYQYMYQTYPELKAWVDSLNQANAIKEIEVSNKEKTKLKAMAIHAAQPTNKTAVIIHGYTDNAVRMLMIAYLYNQQLNYNVLLPNLYGHGNSEGNSIQMGWKDRIDILQWISKANHIFGSNTQMVIHGISMGAATTMMTAGEIGNGKDFPYVKCFVEDCGYTSAWDEFKYELKELFKLPVFPLLHVSSYICQLKHGWNFKEASALEQIKKSSLPMFFIHGDSDTYVPTWMVYPLFEAKPQPKELWLVPATEHAVAYKNYKKEYTERVRLFVNKYIK